MDSYDVTVIVPTHDSAETIGPLAQVVLEIEELSVQLIVVDDASRDRTPQLLEELAARDPRVTALFHETNRGAGVARNTGFPHARGRYTLFFDDDDILHTGALVRTVGELDRGSQSVAVLRYHYQRASGDGATAMNTYDLAFWEDELGEAQTLSVRLADAPGVLGLTNYPWNKVLRTRHYQDAGLRFGSTPVHNDILGHWWSLLFADRILLVNDELCTHVVVAGGSNLTNRGSRDRLALFDALDETYDLLEANPSLRRRYAPQYWEGVVRVASWASDRTSPGMKGQFAERLQEHLMRIDLGDFAALRRRGAPEVAQAIVRKALG